MFADVCVVQGFPMFRIMVFKNIATPWKTHRYFSEVSLVQWFSMFRRVVFKNIATPLKKHWYVSRCVRNTKICNVSEAAASKPFQILRYFELLITSITNQMVWCIRREPTAPTYPTYKQNHPCLTSRYFFLSAQKHTNTCKKHSYFPICFRFTMIFKVFWSDDKKQTKTN